VVAGLEFRGELPRDAGGGHARVAPVILPVRRE
jgi:hypothetical protein